MSQPMPGDELVAAANVVMDRDFTLPATPGEVWPWFVQLGKKRAGWYLPRWVEVAIPPRRRALRHLDQALQRHAVGDRIPDWGGRQAYFDVAIIDAPRALVYRSHRGRVDLSWAISLTDANGRTQVRLRLRLANVKRPWLANSLGDWFDALTVRGLAMGLAERLNEQNAASR